MATIDLSARHALTPEALRAYAQERLAHYDKLHPGLRLAQQFTWRGDTAEGSYMGAKGSLALGPSEVRVRIEIPFLFSAVKPKVEAFVRQELALLSARK
jgi:putative polyhydroxyalkanoate system protein